MQQISWLERKKSIIIWEGIPYDSKRFALNGMDDQRSPTNI
jgi:hypothetical protein